MSYSAELLEALRSVSSATLTTVLLKSGLRNVWIRGASELGAPGQRIVAEAFTLRFVPAREDLATPESWASPISTRAAIEAMPAGCMAIVDAAGGVADVGIFGDILAARMATRGVAGLITDGAVRDIEGIRATGLRVFARAVAAPPSVAGLTFVGWQQPIGCGGVAIFPGDLIVADQDGAVVIPRALVPQTVPLAVEQERFEQWVMGEVRRGVPLPGLYPPDAATKARYNATAIPDSTTK
jgi:regulator of RNase E activity RraA